MKKNVNFMSSSETHDINLINCYRTALLLLATSNVCLLRQQYGKISEPKPQTKHSKYKQICRFVDVNRKKAKPSKHWFNNLWMNGDGEIGKSDEWPTTLILTGEHTNDRLLPMNRWMNEWIPVTNSMNVNRKKMLETASEWCATKKYSMNENHPKPDDIADE